MHKTSHVSFFYFLFLSIPGFKAFPAQCSTIKLELVR